MTDTDLSGTTCIVTGGGRGLGRSMVHALAGAGANVTAAMHIADDIETAFTFGQNWPLGSALSMILIAIIGGLALFGVGKVDLDAIMGRKS